MISGDKKGSIFVVSLFSMFLADFHRVSFRIVRIIEFHFFLSLSLVLQLLKARPHHTSELLSHRLNIIPNCLMMIYNLKQQTLVYLRHSMVVVIQLYETVLLLVILIMAIIENQNNHHHQYCSRPISFSLLVSYTVSIALSLSISFCVCACV